MAKKKAAPKPIVPTPLQKLTAQQQRFCELVVGGMSDLAAYMEAYEATRENAHANAWRVKAIEGVGEVIAEGKAASWSKACMSAAEKRAFLARVVRTPIGEVDELSDLCQEKTETNSAESSTTKLKMPDKLAAIRLDNDLAADGAEAAANKALEIIIRRL